MCGFRAIKFRQWYEGEMRPFGFSTDRNGCIDFTCAQNNRIDKYPVMQFTGVKDKNGVEIFEGDILSNKMVNPKLGQVIYRKDGFNLKAVKNFRCVYESLAINSCDVVIGNIHDNPELLEGAQS